MAAPRWPAGRRPANLSPAPAILPPGIVFPVADPPPDGDPLPPAALPRGPFCRRPRRPLSVPPREQLVQHLLPAAGYAPLGSRHRLVERVMLGRRELRAVVGLIGLEAPEPVLAGLEAADERMSCGLRVRGSVLFRRGVAAADVSALRAPAQVQPPTARRLAFDAAGPAGRNGRVDSRHLGHADSSLLASGSAPSASW